MAAKRPRTHITDADESHEADTRARSQRYLVSMSIRMVCFVLAIVTTGWVRWACVAGAVLLPWIAVQIANAGKENNTKMRTALIDGPPRSALPEGTGAGQGASGAAGPEAPSASSADHPSAGRAGGEHVRGYTVFRAGPAASDADASTVGAADDHVGMTEGRQAAGRQTADERTARFSGDVIEGEVIEGEVVIPDEAPEEGDGRDG